MGLRNAYRTRLAGQLGHPRGLAGRAVGAMLNRNNRSRVTGAVDALEIRTGEEVADIGFGGGIGLGLLLDRVGTVGRVHGVEISARMLATAGRRYRSAAAAAQHGFRVRPVDEVTAALGAAGLELTADERVGNGPGAFHVVVCTPAPPSPLDPDD